ncbi:MAG: exosortase C-terminal domain/associated protein EpsI [Bryobacteraceae bacterium]|jgi:EpsI family protein
MHSPPPLSVAAFLVVQAVVVHWVAGTERPPAPPDLAALPSAIGEWTGIADNPLAPDVAAELKADRVLSRTYYNRKANTSAELFIAWFQSQRSGERQPHSPKVCLPGSGWFPISTGTMELDTADGAITVNRYIVANQRAQAVVLYWYQTPRRVVAGEWAAKLWLLFDAARDHRTDTALVRVVVPVVQQGDGAAVAAAGFTRSVYPFLRKCLPHLDANAIARAPAASWASPVKGLDSSN